MLHQYPLRLPLNEPVVTLTNPKGSVWVIELHNGADSRLTESLLESGLKPALDAVERHWREQWRTAKASSDKKGGGGAVIIVGNRSQDKFFSNGLDFAKISGNPKFFTNVFNTLLTRLITFPIPTIAALNGHCFAGGFVLAMACDYRVMTDGSKRNAWMCMNEVHFGAMWPLSMSAIMRAKFGDGRLHRKIALEGHRFTPKEALDAGLVDHIVDGSTETILANAVSLGERVGQIAKEGVWGLIKTTLYADALEDFRKDVVLTSPAIEDSKAKARL